MSGVFILQEYIIRGDYMDYEVLANGKIQLGGKAPDFTCNSTRGQINVPDKSGCWTVIFSYQEDFYNMATAEMIFLEQNKHLFEELNCKIICMSTGNLLSHNAWINEIYRLNGVQISFPIIDDPIGEIARKYGAVAKELGNNYVTSNVIIIDSAGIVRGNFEYMPCVGRNIFEIVRVLRELEKCIL